MTIHLPDTASSPLITARLDNVLNERRSVRRFDDRPLETNSLAFLLWACYGATERGGRTAPSAGGLYPLEILVVVERVAGIEPGIYRYRPEELELELTRAGSVADRLAGACFDQTWIRQAAVSIVLAAIFERVTARYDRRGVHYVYLDAGHAAQNVCLAATAIGLGTVPVGAFADDEVARVIGAGRGEKPVYVLPIGHTAS